MLHLNVMAILERDLGKLKEEIRQYRNQQCLWKVAPGTTNSGGNLVLHLCGNLRHFIGAVLGRSSYVREREREFSDKNLHPGELIKIVEATVHEVIPVLKNLDPRQLQEDFPKEIGGVKRNTAFVLLHLLGHFSYHLGQINYHRRIISSEESGL